jgi:hypothetical protein
MSGATGVAPIPAACDLGYRDRPVHRSVVLVQMPEVIELRLPSNGKLAGVVGRIAPRSRALPLPATLLQWATEVIE